MNIIIFLLLMSIMISCSDDSQPPLIAIETENDDIYDLPDKIQDAKEAIEFLDQDWDYPEEAAYNIKLKERLEQRLVFLQALERSPFVYQSGEIRIQRSFGELTEAQYEQYDLASIALETLVERGLQIAEGVKLLVEDEADKATVTFAANFPKSALGPDYTAKVIFDSDTGEVINVIGGI